MLNGENLLDIPGLKPTKYGLNLVKHFYKQDFYNYVCTDRCEQPYNSKKIPMSSEYIELMKSNIVFSCF